MSKHIFSNDLVSRHYIEFQTAETFRGKPLHYVTLSGVALANVKGQTSGNWYRDKLILHIPFPFQHVPGIGTRPNDHHAKYACKHWSAYAGLNAVWNANHSVNSGHAVDTFRISNPFDIEYTVSLECNIAVRDSDAWLYRIGYQVGLLVYFDSWQRDVIVN